MPGALRGSSPATECRAVVGRFSHRIQSSGLNLAVASLLTIALSYVWHQQESGCGNDHRNSYRQGLARQPTLLRHTHSGGQNQMFKIPEGQKFTVNGQETDAWGLKDGMRVTATKITTAEVTSVTEKTQVTGTMPPDAPVLIAAREPTPAPAASATTANAGGAAATGTAAGPGATNTEPEQSRATTSRWPLLRRVSCTHCNFRLTWKQVPPQETRLASAQRG
jgi:hypothetical protein